MTLVEEHPGPDDYISRVRRICMTLPGTSEKVSHGEPTFFVNKRVYCMFANNHHQDGHVAVWVPVEAGLQGLLIKQRPATYFHPPYVGVKGWVGIELSRIDDDELAAHLSDAHRLIGRRPGRKPRQKL